MPRSRTTRTLLTALALVLALAWAFPVYWMLNSAFLPNVVLQSTTPTFLPFGGSLDNLRAVVTDPSFGSALTTSLVVTLTTVVAAIVVAFLGALAISRFRFRGRASFVLALLLLLIEITGPVVAEKGRADGTPWHPHHIAERYALLAMIALGEGILGTVAAMSGLVHGHAAGWTRDAVIVLAAPAHARRLAAWMKTFESKGIAAAPISAVVRSGS